MGDVDHRGVELCLNLLEVGTQRQTRLNVQGAHGLVEQNDGGVEGKCARNGDALLLAAGELRDPFGPLVGQADAREQVAGDPGLVGLQFLTEGEWVLHVLAHRHVLEQSVVLKDNAHTPLGGRQAREVGAS